MIKGIRNVGDAIGKYSKFVQLSEKQNLAPIRKSIVASQNISKGEKFSEENLAFKRPGTGMSPALAFNLYGCIATRTYLKDEVIDEII